MNTCETCQFRSVQECRRFPPVIVESRSSRREWPHVEWNDWCGEYKEKPEPKSNRPHGYGYP